jgi:LysM repeat protein
MVSQISGGVVVPIPVHLRVYRIGLVLVVGLVLSGCSLRLPEPPPSNLPTLPAVLDITPAPTLDIDATATAYANPDRPTATPEGIYVIEAGDTLSELAERFNTTVDDLAAANGLTDPNALQPGQTLIIPSQIRTPVVAPTSTEAAPTATLTSP